MSGRIWISSDLHFCHDREFIWGPRGFEYIETHNETLIQNFNNLVAPDDDLYLLGDLMLNRNQEGFELLNKLNGRLHIVRGNHDTDVRWELYKQLPKVVEMDDVIRLKYKGYHFYLSHYPTLTANLEKESLKVIEINLCGHGHVTNKYQDMDKGIIYHCEIDAHNCYPISIDKVLQDIKNFGQKCS